MRRQPTPEERGKIMQALVDGDRIEATSLYISITECGLTQAQEFLKSLTSEINDGKSELPPKKPKKKGWFR